MSQQWPYYRAKVAGLTRDRSPDDPELVAARQDLRAARLRMHIERAIIADPPLTAEQRVTLGALLVGGDHV